MDDTDQVLNKLFLWRQLILPENHDLTTSSLDNPFNEFESKSAKSVMVGNHKRDAFS